MLVIPDTYYKNNEDYITLPAIRAFARSHPAFQFKGALPREAILDSILEYGSQSSENAEAVLSWIDSVLQEGIKDIHVHYAPLKDEMNLLFSSDGGVTNHLRAYLSGSISEHICKNQYGAHYTLVFAKYSKEGPHGRKISFAYCKKLYVHDKITHRTKPIDYPVMADYYLDTAWLIVRAKPRSNLYKYTPNAFDLETAESTTTEKEILEVIGLVGNILGTSRADKASTIAVLKNKVFKILDKYSRTPEVIENIIQSKDAQIQSISSSIQSMCSIPGHCEISASAISDIQEDIRNIIEKYLSINWQDKNIFIQDRDAYPVKISATDEEESKVEQSAAMEEPLQTKALFFDNKKMLYKNERCDGVYFQWKRLDATGYPKKSFAIRITVSNRGHCIFKFSEYTSEEDIENVIFSILDN